MVALHHPPLTLYRDARADAEELRVDGRRLDHSLCARREPRVRLVIRERDWDHAVGICDVPLLFGEQMMLRFPARAGRAAWNAFGRVSGCEANEEGYRVTIEFGPLPAA